MVAGAALTWTVFRTVMSGVERRASQSQEIRLDNPMFHGQDAQGRAFLIGAKGAIRDPDTGHFRLVGPVLRLNLGGRKVTQMTADGAAGRCPSHQTAVGPRSVSAAPTTGGAVESNV